MSGGPPLAPRQGPLGDEAVRALADEILREPDFARFRATGYEWLVYAADWLGDLIDGLQALRLASPLLYWGIIGALLLVLIGLVTHLAVSLRAALRSPASATASARRPAAPVFAAEAAALAAEGRYLEAAHRLELGSIHALVSRGWIELERHDPNRTLRARLAASRLARRERTRFVALLDRLERHWFRDRAEAEPEELYAQWKALHGRLEALPEAP